MVERKVKTVIIIKCLLLNVFLINYRFIILKRSKHEENMKRLEYKTAVITGGVQGIGKATVVKFLNEGASVAVWDVNEEAGKKWNPD